MRQLLWIVFWLSCSICMAETAMQESRNKYFTIHYPPRYLHTATLLSAEADRFARGFCGEMRIQRPAEPIPVILDPHASRGEIYPTPRWVNGFYDPGNGTIVLKTLERLNRRQEAELLTVFRHEAVHALLDLEDRSLPRWLEEGLAQTFSSGFTIWDGRLLLQVPREEMATFLRESAFTSGDTARLAYPLAAGATAYLRELGGHNLRILLDRSRTLPFQQAFTSVYGTNQQIFLLMFRESFLSRYTVTSLLVTDEGLLTMLSVLALVLLIARHVRIRRRLANLDDGLHPEELPEHLGETPPTHMISDNPGSPPEPAEPEPE